MFPHAFVIISTGLSLSDGRLYEASTVLKASRLRTFFTVTLPGAKYGLISATFVVFTHAITDFGVPKVIGGQYDVLATDIYKQVIGQQNFEMGAVVSVVAGVVVVGGVVAVDAGVDGSVTGGGVVGVAEVGAGDWVGEGVDLVGHQERVFLLDVEFLQHRPHGGNLGVDQRARGIGHMQEQVGLPGFLERGLEAGDQAVGQVADEPDRIADQHRPPAG